MKRSKLIENLLTQANETAKAFADFAASISAVRMRLLLAAYGDTTSRLVGALQTDASGRILANAKNLEIQNRIEAATKAFVDAAGAEKLVRDAAQATAISLEKSTATIRAAIGGNLDDIPVSALRQSSLYGAISVQRTTVQIATGIGSRANDLISDAIIRYQGNKDDLISTLFSPEGLEFFQKKNADSLRWATGMSGKAADYVDSLKKGIKPIEDIRTSFRDELDKYIEQRKGLRETGQPSLFENDGLETKAINEVQPKIMEAHQDYIYRETARLAPKAKFVNAKNTAHDDNCIDAMEADPMTLEEWRDSPYGIPRSPKRDCGIYCKCLQWCSVRPVS